MHTLTLHWCIHINLFSPDGIISIKYKNQWSKAVFTENRQSSLIDILFKQISEGREFQWLVTPIHLVLGIKSCKIILLSIKPRALLLKHLSSTRLAL